MIVHSGRQNIAEDVAAAIRRHQDGDANAMEDLFRIVRPWLHGIGRACRLSIHSADDVVQNTMAVALTHLPRLRDPNAGLAWLSVIARREAIKISREERRTDPIGDRDAWTGGAEDPEEIALAHCDGGFYALQGHCLHLKGPLGEGHMEGCVLSCPWHGWQYDVRTGKNEFDLAIQLRTYDVQVEDGEVRVRI